MELILSYTNSDRNQWILSMIHRPARRWNRWWI